jgi:NAD(P)-dependent dehydrogenase (short-subunit alcohol dehydrogenase family)
MPDGASRAVILTGGAGGIGAAMTAALLAAGHCVAAVDNNAQSLARLAARHAADAERLLTIEADITQEAAAQRAVEDSLRAFGRVEALVNNAGIGVSMLRPDAEARVPTVEEITPEVWDRFFAVNVRAAMLTMRAALPHMRAARFGRIVNNTTSYRTMLRVLPYGATKAALESMSAVWAQELEGSGITVNVLVPGGPTDTPLVGAGSGWPRDKMLRPAGMGPPLCYLVSDAASRVTGQRITAGRWDPAKTTAENMAHASRAIGWPELAGDAVWPT